MRRFESFRNRLSTKIKYFQLSLLTIVTVLSFNLIYLAQAQAATPLSFAISCTASKAAPAFGISYGIIYTNFSSHVYGARSSTSATLAKLTWSFTNAHYQPIAPPGPPLPAQISSKGNINIIGHYTSADSLGTSGTLNFPDFTIKRGTTVNIQAIPDIRNISDPSCTASHLVNW